MQQPVEPVSVRGVYPRPSQPERQVWEDEEKLLPHAHSENGGETVRVPQRERRRFQPDFIGTMTITTAGGSLLLGVPFGMVGAVIGGVLGLLLGVYNETAS